MRRSPLPAMALLAAIALVACSSTQDVLEPSAIDAQQLAPAQPGTPAEPGAPASPPLASTAPAGPATPIRSGVRIQFAPIVGATVEAAGPLTERLVIRARERGIGMAGGAATPATNVIKGYFSAITEGAETTVIYVWDVYDRAGNRVHRLNGQQKQPANGGDGWASVTPATMQAIADTTIDQLAAWLSAAPG
jgi:hypothetical protein